VSSVLVAPVVILDTLRSNKQLSLQREKSEESSFCHLVDKAQDFSTDVLPSGLFVVHDAGRSGHDDVAERTGR